MKKTDPSVIRELTDRYIDAELCDIDVRFDEPMSEHTTFKIGGPADIWLRPHGEAFPSFCSELICLAKKEEIPVFILGGGANIVVADKGIRGIVLDMNAWRGHSVWALCAQEDELILKSGTDIDEAADIAVTTGLSGLEFLAGMPGTIGGAVWMNARCYSIEVADVLSWAEIIDFGPCASGGEPRTERICTGDGFGYKLSPFQKKDCLILSACFKLKPGDKSKMLDEMEKNRQDRDEKGHYLFPCAGSAFRNNRDFGRHTGQIIDGLGLKGLQSGGAQIAPFHGNIVINTGNATANDIRALMDETAAKVKAATGFVLEPEILFVGEW
jgi:UDP-N-acetylmuramate dehydrogenase